MKPNRVNLSIGTAAMLRLVDVPMADAPTAAYLMLGGRCLMNCAFCAQSRGSQASALHLSRVTWPEFALADALERLAQAAAEGRIRRACIQVTVTGDSFEQAVGILRAVRGSTKLPVDVAILPRDLDQAAQLVDAGVDHIGFGLDAASEPVFREVKGGHWAHSLSLIEATTRAYPGRAALHLIVGLGETEHEMVERIQWAHSQGITVGLFAFTPVRGTRLAGRSAPPLAAYRRMQAARWLIVHDSVHLEDMTFDSFGRLTALGASLEGTGEPFQTSGCPDCNRPYYNERPGGIMYNYPRPLSPTEAARAIRETEISA